MSDEPEELNDPFSDVGEGLNYITLGSETTEDLGDAFVRVVPSDGSPIHEFDAVLVCDVAGEPTVIGKEAIQAQGEAHLLPTWIKKFSDVEAIVTPLDDGRLEEADAELIGVNG